MIREDDVAALLREATDTVEISPAPAEELARAGRRRLRRQRSIAVGGSVAAVAAVAVGIPLLSSPGNGTADPAAPPDSVSKPTTADPAPRAFGCADTSTPHVLPKWARAGFSGSRPEIPFVSGREGRIVAILFAPPRMSPGGDGSNKVLWVSRLSVDPLSSLSIKARLQGTATTIMREVEGGPGPSGLKLPAPGCWHLDLAWSGHTDRVDLYVKPG